MNALLFRAPNMKGPGPRNPFRHGRRSKYPEDAGGSKFDRLWPSPLKPGARYTDFSDMTYGCGQGGCHIRLGKETIVDAGSAT